MWRNLWMAPKFKLGEIFSFFRYIINAYLCIGNNEVRTDYHIMSGNRKHNYLLKKYFFLQANNDIYSIILALKIWQESRFHNHITRTLDLK